MAVIDRVQLLADEKVWLPTENVLTDPEMEAINELVIANQIPEDDDIYYSECLCKCLRAIAQANLAKSSVSSSNAKRQKVGQVEIEKFKTSSNAWTDYLKSLKDICPIFGYTGISTGSGIFINPSDPVSVNDCPCPDETYL